MTEIKDGLFEYCSSLASIELPSSISKIGSQAFYGCTSLTEFQFPEGITEISQAVLWGCSNLSKVTMPSSVSTIGIGAFYGCKSLVEIEISDQIVNIPDNTFNGCSSLTSIVIPENVMQIGKDAFSFCSGLKTIISKATIPPYCQSSTFYGVDKANCQLFVPEGSVDAYKNDNYWKEFYNCSNIATISTDDKLELVYSLGGYITNSANKGISIINNGGTHRVILVR